MRYSVALMILGVIAPRLTFAQEDLQTKKVTAESTPSEMPASFVIQLTEFRMKSSLDPQVRAADIVAAFAAADDGDTVQLVETIRVSAIGGTECTVQSSRRTSVTVGMVTFGRGGPPAAAPVRQTQPQEVGTMVRVTATPQLGKVLVRLSYEASRMEGEGTNDSPPDTVTAVVDTTQLVEIGKPTFVGGSTAESSSLLMLTVFAAE